MDNLLTGVWSNGDGRVVLKLSGEIDLASELAFRGYLHMLADGKPAVLDFTSVEFMDSTGIRAILQHRERLQKTGGSLHLRNPGDMVRRALEVSVLTDLIE